MTEGFETWRDESRRRSRERREREEAERAAREAAYVADAESRGVDARTQVVTWWLYNVFAEVNGPADFECHAGELLALLDRLKLTCPPPSGGGGPGPTRATGPASG